jgi:hypothetical protein
MNQMGTLKPGATYIYESPDKGKTVYARESGSTERKLVGYQYDLFEDVNWHEIALDARTNPALQKVLERAILIHKLSKDYGKTTTK